MPLTRILAAALLASSLGACASSRFEADVVRFHRDDVAERTTVSLRPANPDLAQSLEFQSYAEILGQRLARLGFQPTSGDAPALIGEVSYTTVNRSVLRDHSSSPVSVGVGLGGGGGHLGGGIGLSFGLGGNKDKGGIRIHTLALRLMKPGGETVWEGRAETETRMSDNGNLDAQTVFPRLADALLADFPGPSGITTQYVEPSGR